MSISRVKGLIVIYGLSSSTIFFTLSNKNGTIFGEKEKHRNNSITSEDDDLLRESIRTK